MQRLRNWRWVWYVVAIWVAAFLLFWMTRHSFGLTWDEPAYMRAAIAYTEWQGRVFTEGPFVLQPAIMRAYWEYNHEHPPLVKVWLGWLALFVPASWSLIDTYRFGAMTLSATLVAVVALSVARLTSAWGGIVAAVVLCALPRFFFHAHVAALDVPGALAYLLVILLFWHLRARSEWWLGLALGVLFGLALATKINAAFALPVLGLWWVVRSREPHLLGRIVVMTAVGVLCFVGVWPWLWVDPVSHLAEYVAWLTVAHWQIPQWWFGRALLPPPWYFAPLMAVMVTPLAVLLTAVGGVFWGVHQVRLRDYMILLVLSGAMPLVALMLSDTVYDNDRLFMAFFPVLAMCAAVAVWGLTQRVPERWRSVVMVGCLVVIIANPVRDSVRLWPHLLSYYSETITGLPGAQRLRLDHTYWNETYITAMRVLDQHAPHGATVWVEPWSLDVPHTYQKARMIRRDVQYVSDAGNSIWGTPVTHMPLVEADYAIITHRFAGWTGPVWALVGGNSVPIFVIERDGVVLLELYQMP